ncbi:MAG TPA: hypothetical protein VNY36_02140, partial [Bacteroidia bacterium]|nr:hypothetical protein [Bacteroidia bacterium]
MKKFYTLLLVFFSFFITENVSAAGDIYPNTQTSFTGAGTYCQGYTPTLVFTFSTRTCAGGGTNIPITVKWYSNTTNSTAIGTATLYQTIVSTSATTSYTFNPPVVTAGTLWYFAVVSWAAGPNCAPLGTLTSTTQKIIVTASTSTYNSSLVDQYSASNIDLNCTDLTNAIAEIKITVTSSGTCPPIISQFNFTTAGSTNAGTDISKARIYYTQQTSGYNAFRFFGSVNNPNGAFTINGVQPLLLGSGTYYFYLCYDVPSTATSGDIVDATLSSFVFNGTSENNMSPNPVVSVTLGGGACHTNPDLPSPTSNIQTVTAGSLVIPMDNSHQNLWLGRPFNTKAYGLVRALLMQDIPVKWVIKSGKIKDSSDFSANAFQEYPTVTAASLQYFKSGEFIVDTTYLARSVYPGEKTATQVISTFASRWLV